VTPTHWLSALARRGAALVSAALLLSAPLLTRRAAFASPPATATGGPGPAVAVEDTMHTKVPEVLVRAPRVTLDEILDRVARGEARRDSLLRDLSFTATMRVVRNTAGKGTPELFAESVSKVYKKKPNGVRTIALRKYEKYPDKGGENDDTVDSDFSPGMGEEIVNFAFRPENRRNYRFSIEDRKLLGDHLLYTLHFEPRSALAVYEPSGRVWVDTKEFVILRQELEFKQSPVPLFLKSIRHMVVERTHAGEFWVMSRLLMRIELTIPVPRFGRSFDFAMAFSDYTVNTDLPDSLFAASGKPEDGAHVRVTVGRTGKGKKS
jgi:outer membrane lipoprotein-sorting protein